MDESDKDDHVPLKWLREIYSSYHHFFKQYSGDPGFATRAFLPLTLLSIIGISLGLLRELGVASLIYHINPHFVGVIFFLSVLISYFFELPEPKEKKYISYISVVIVALFISYPVALSFVMDKPPSPPDTTKEITVETGHGEMTSEVQCASDAPARSEVRVRQVYIKPDSTIANPISEAYRRAHNVRSMIEDDKTIASVARKRSDGPSGKKGGDLGFFERGDMVEPFEKVAFCLPKDTVSPVVQTTFGYHVLVVTDEKF